MADTFSRVIALIQRATAAIPANCIEFPVARRVTPTHRERVYCGELYHQMRKRWSTYFSEHELSNEPDKDGHPVIPGSKIPDLIVHVPGVMNHNVAVIEVKFLPVSRRGTEKDIDTLRTFFRYGEYSGGVLLFVGRSSSDGVVKLVRDRFRRSQRAVVLLHHEAPGKRCVVRLALGL